MLGFAPIASGPLSALPGINLYPYTLTNTNYIYDLAFGVSPVTIDVTNIASSNVIYQVIAGLGFVNIYPETIVNSNNVYGIITFVFDKATTVFKTNIVIVKEPYNVVVSTPTNKFIKIDAFLLN